MSTENLEIDLFDVTYGLNTICKCLNKLYDINSGGCCYIAYCLAEILESENIEYKVVLYGCEDTINDFSALDIDCRHVYLEVGDYKINSDGAEYGEPLQRFDNVTSSEILNYYKSCEWNDLYKDSLNRFIKKLINDMWKHYKQINS